MEENQSPIPPRNHFFETIRRTFSIPNLDEDDNEEVRGDDADDKPRSKHQHKPASVKNTCASTHKQLHLYRALRV